MCVIIQLTQMTARFVLVNFAQKLCGWLGGVGVGGRVRERERERRERERERERERAYSTMGVGVGVCMHACLGVFMCV